MLPAMAQHAVEKIINAIPTVAMIENVVRADSMKLLSPDSTKDSPTIKANPTLTAVVLVGKTVVGEIKDRLDTVDEVGV
jgi:cell division protein FtsX